MSQANVSNETKTNEVEKNDKPKRQYKRKTRNENESNTDSKPEFNTDSKPESNTDSKPESNTDSKPESESKADSNESESIFNQNFWKPSIDIIDALWKIIKDKYENVYGVMEMTNYPSVNAFAKSSKRLDWCTCTPSMITPDVDYIFIRHTLERVQRPQDFLEQIKQNVPKGYIETTSIFAEMTREVYANAQFRGHLLSKYIIWSDEENVLHILPKAPILEHIRFEEGFEKNIREGLKEIPYYWNSYYMWDEEQPLKWVYYQHGVNFNANTEYMKIVQKAFDDVKYSIHKFLKHINDIVDIDKEASS